MWECRRNIFISTITITKTFIHNHNKKNKTLHLLSQTHNLYYNIQNNIIFNILNKIKKKNTYVFYLFFLTNYLFSKHCI